MAKGPFGEYNFGDRIYPGWAFLEDVGPNLRVPCEWPVLLAAHQRGDDPADWRDWARGGPLPGVVVEDKSSLPLTQEQDIEHTGVCPVLGFRGKTQ